jgi:hypothetical protein
MGPAGGNMGAVWGLNLALELAPEAPEPLYRSGPGRDPR